MTTEEMIEWLESEYNAIQEIMGKATSSMKRIQWMLDEYYNIRDGEE